LSKTKTGVTPLCLAAQEGHLEVVKFLTIEGANPSLPRTYTTERQWYRRETLHRVSWMPDDEEESKHYVIEQLIEEETELLGDMKQEDLEYISPLYLATQNGHAEVVEWLLQNGAQTDDVAFSKIGIIAAQEGYAEVMDVLVKQCKRELFSECAPIFSLWACLNGHQEVVRVLVDLGMEVDQQIGDGMTPLHCAALGGSVELVEFLVEKGANVNSVTDDGMSVIQCAVQQKHTEVASMLRSISCTLQQE
jgi:ankyrin repeat protein